MAFLNPWAIAIGVLVLGAPIAVHFLTRPRPVEFPLSTIRLLNEVIQQRRARSRLRDWLILLVRMAAIGLLAAAFARPFFQNGPVVTRTAEGDTARVILLDVSQSMAAGSGGAQRITQGKAAAIEFLDGAPGVNAGVILVGATPRPVFDEISPNLASLRSAVEEAIARPEGANVNSALQMAGSMLSAAQAKNRELVIISDFQRTNWGTARMDALPAETDVQFHSVASPVLDNIAITGTRFAAQPMIGQPAEMEVDLANFSDIDRELTCNIKVGRWQRSLTTSVPARSSRTLTQTLAIDQLGWIHGSVSLMSNLDAVVADDSRPLVVEVRDAPQIVLISRQPASASLTSSWYLQQALNVAFADQRNETPVQRLHPGRTTPALWPESDVYVIDHPGSLDDDAIAFLTARVRRGRGLLYVTSELADAMNMKKLAASLGSGFEPPVELSAASSDRSREELFVSRVASRRRPFRLLGNSVESALRPVRFSGGFPNARTDEGLRDQVLAELSDSSALLYITAADAGRISVLNTDLTQSNWPVQPTFVPILAELIDELLRGGTNAAEAICGEPLVRVLPPSVQNIDELTVVPATEATPPADDYGQYRTTGADEGPSGGGSYVWTWPEPIGPGVYEVRHGATVAMAVALAAPASESDLQTLDESVLRDRIGKGRNVGYSTPADDDRNDDRWWTWLIVFCTLGLIVELGLLRGFRA